MQCTWFTVAILYVGSFTEFLINAVLLFLECTVLLIPATIISIYEQLNTSVNFQLIIKQYPY